MRLTKTFVPTLRDDPADAEIASHRLLLRAGFIRRLTAGVYTSLPLALRVIRKVEAIVREEMEASGSIEIRVPIVLPAEPWKATGRWQRYGNEVFKLEDRHGREMMLGPTEEEVFAPLVAGDLPSYRDLPINLFQVEWKYRDEKRPRFGLLRGREFLMKDAYSFDRDEAGMRESYRVMYEAYERIFDRIGLGYVIVEADPGSIGGGINHEFMALADVGEDLFVRCVNGDYLADIEAATPEAAPAVEAELEPMVEVETPGAATIELVAAQLGIDEARTLKNVMFDVDGQTVAVLVPGDREVSEKKLARLYFPKVVRAFDDDDFERRGYAKGYVGPHGFDRDVAVLADPSVRAGANWVTGANRTDMHVTGMNLERDFRVDRWEALVQIRDGDRCPIDGGELEVGRSIVVGHIYQLSTEYSDPLRASFQDEDGSEKPYMMGCYGIGITRILAALVEQNHDGEGIVWPRHLAPFDVVVILANADDEPVRTEAERIYAALGQRGIEVVIDDREERAGVKFADADLIGYPVQVTVGKRGLAAGTVDLKVRASGERSTATLEDAVQAATDLLAGAP
ncbi:MAG: proline--tRNA ligase [Actinomycetota bacterium]|nr:proline--tRNA ligase [Actinomycetota bacterium]MDH5224568.1 proline--tRNA ligase [Actinomycetota bacterium]